MLITVGGFAFGLVVGWVTYGCLRRAKRGGLTDLSTVLGAIGGGAITGLFPAETNPFAGYCIGLAVGFFGYLLFATTLKGRAPEWLGEAPAGSGTSGSGVPKAP